MRCEVVAVGTELLLGQIVDTNSAWMGEQLALAGIDVNFGSTVGDNLERIIAALRIALERNDAVLVCGGLGPTQDDITRDAIAAVMGVPLELDDEVAARIEQMFAARGRVMAANNMRQAEVPKGGWAIRDPQPGTAPGLICPVGDKVIYAVPGVPHEMRTIVASAIVPDLRRRSGATAVIMSRVLRTWGESESRLAELLADRIRVLDATGNPTLAFLASGIEGLKVRITAKAPDEASTLELLADEEAELRALLGQLVFGVDDESMEHAVGVLLDAHGLTLGLAESITGGLMGARLTDVAGASGFFKGSIVSYDSQVKFTLLGVPDGPVVSAEAAVAMAQGARQVLGADVGLAVTGVAGPAEQDGQPVGTVFIGIGTRRRRRVGAAAASWRPPAHPRVHCHLGPRPAAPAPARTRQLTRCGCSSRSGRDAEILDELATLPRPPLEGVRWTTRDQWHVTLRFFGEVEDAAPVERALARAVTQVTAVRAQFEERVRRVGNMLWAPVKGLDAVADAVVSATASIGAAPEARRFRGHITLARARSRREKCGVAVLCSRAAGGGVDGGGCRSGPQPPGTEGRPVRDGRPVRPGWLGGLLVVDEIDRLGRCRDRPELVEQPLPLHAVGQPAKSLFMVGGLVHGSSVGLSA